MAHAIYSGLTTIGAHLWGMTFGYPDPLEIKATPQNLKTAIREKCQNVLSFKFKDASKTIRSALEYAVEINDNDD
jgi:hypothetical protein